MLSWYLLFFVFLYSFVGSTLLNNLIMDIFLLGQGWCVLHIIHLSAVDIYAGVAASLAERKKGGQLTELLKNIKGTIDEDDWDQVKNKDFLIFHILSWMILTSG